MFLSAGIWKLTDPVGWSATLSQLKVSSQLALAGAIALGIVEVWCAVLLLVPRHRRWGAWVTAALLVFFMVYIGYFYEELRGKDCSCFPWMKRAVGPGFFIGDLLMLLLAGAAGWWAQRSGNVRAAGLSLMGVVAFAGASYGVVSMRSAGVRAPDHITVDGKQTAFSQGKTLLYFYDPECLHCDEAARRLSTHKWNDTAIVAIPTRMPQFAADFLKSTKLPAGTSNDHEVLKKTFPFGDPPYAVALENGRQMAALPLFDKKEPEASLRALGFIQ